jgi:guanylate kinase
MLFIVSGPSGSGKTTLVERLLQTPLKRPLTKPVSFTSRSARHNEKNGEDYFFISREEFEKKRAANELLEWTEFLGSFYGTPRKQVEKALEEGRDLIFCLDIRGALYLKEKYKDKVVLIFIVPPSLEELRRRIIQRSHLTQEAEIQKRLEEAKRELTFTRQYDHVIANENIDLATGQLLDIIKGYRENVSPTK